jgi:hypothetical protein
MTPLARRRQWIALIILGLVATAGCDPLSSMAYLLTLSGDPKVEGQCHLTREDKKPSKVVILVSTGAVETREQLISADRELAGLLITKLQEGCKSNKEKVTVLPASRVQRYKDEHPNWQAVGAEEVGKYFRADFVVDIEIGAMTMYERRSANQMYRGNAEVSVAVHDLHKPGEEPTFNTVYTCEYPASRPVPVTDSTYQKFRLQFLTHVATELSWYFTAHDVSDHVPVD